MTAAATTTTAAGRLGRNYWKLFSASASTNLGDGLMTLAVVWLASSLTRDATLIALVGLASRLPWLLFSLPAGVITDRYDRRRLVAWMDVARFGIVAAFAAVVLATQDGMPTPEQLASGAADAPSTAPALITLLCLAGLLIGFAEVVRDNSAQTLMPSIVDKGVLEKANGRMWGAETVMNNFVGPPLAGALIGVALAVPFFVNAGLLAVAAALVFALAGTFAPKGQITTGRIAWRAEIGAGFGWLWNHRLLRALAILLGSLNMLGSMAFVVLVLYAQEILGLFEGWQYGALLTGTATGAVIGSVLAHRVSRALTPGSSLFTAMIGMGAGLLTIGLVASPPVVWSAGVLSGFMIVLWNIITVSLRQRIIPDHLLGRVNSVYRFFGWGTISLGTLLGGLLVTLGEPVVGREWALRAPYVIAGVTTVLLLAYALPRINTAQIHAAQAAADQQSGGHRMDLPRGSA
jgi:MFS family permease